MGCNFKTVVHRALVAQLVARRSDKAKVIGSSPVESTELKFCQFLIIVSTFYFLLLLFFFWSRDRRKQCSSSKKVYYEQCSASAHGITVHVALLDRVLLDRIVGSSVSGNASATIFCVHESTASWKSESFSPKSRQLSDNESCLLRIGTISIRQFYYRN